MATMNEILDELIYAMDNLGLVNPDPDYNMVAEAKQLFEKLDLGMRAGFPIPDRWDTRKNPLDPDEGAQFDDDFCKDT